MHDKGFGVVLVESIVVELVVVELVAVELSYIYMYYLSYHSARRRNPVATFR